MDRSTQKSPLSGAGRGFSVLACVGPQRFFGETRVQPVHGMFGIVSPVLFV